MIYVYVILVLMLVVQLLSSAQPNNCTATMQAVKDSVLILSDDLVDANTAQEKCSLLGGNLAMTDDPQINTTLTQLMTDKYTTDLQRVYILYATIDNERYKYSYISTEIGWISSKSIGHLWYFDLFKSNPENMGRPIYFCAYAKGDKNLERWYVTIGTDCSAEGWTFRYSLFSDMDTSKRQKETFNYGSVVPKRSTKLRSVNESFESFTTYDGSFLAPNINVLVGARYNTTLNSWYWSDGSPANFSVSNITTCQQGALHYGIGWEQSSLKCSGKTAYYACQVKFKASVEKTICNASTVVVSWTGLDQIIENHNLLAEVEIYVLELNQRFMAQYTDQLTNIVNLSFATEYSFEITTMFTGCLNANVSTATSIRTYGNPPSSCYPPVNATAETFPCNASTVLVSWTGLDQFINFNDLFAQVEIQIEGLNETISVPYSDDSIILEDLIYSTVYEIQVTVIVTGSINTNITSNLTVTTPGNPPQNCFPGDNTANPATNIGMIAGLVIGLLLLVLAIVGLVVMFIRRRRSSKQTEKQTTQVQFPPKRTEGISTNASKDEYETVIKFEQTDPNPTYEIIMF